MRIRRIRWIRWIRSKKVLSAVMIISLSLLPVKDVTDYNTKMIYADSGIDASIMCGDSSYWILDATNRVLTIYGTGAVDRRTFDIDVDKIIIEEGITAIGDNIFTNSTVKEVEFPSTLRTIGESAFWGCVNITQLNIPKRVTEIGDFAFEKCEALEEITVDESNVAYRAVDGVLYDRYQAELVLYPASKDAEEFAIPSSVMKLGTYAFDYNSKLKKLTIPAGLISLGEGTPFTGVRAIESFIVDKNNGTFCSVDGHLYNKKATRLIKYAVGSTERSFSAPDTVNEIADGAFRLAENLESIELPDTVNQIGYGAFADCSCLGRITVWNPECEITAGAILGNVNMENLVICGLENSTAMAYAQSKGIGFMAVEKEQEPETEPKTEKEPETEAKTEKESEQKNEPETESQTRSETTTGTEVTKKTETNTNRQNNKEQTTQQETKKKAEDDTRNTKVGKVVIKSATKKGKKAKKAKIVLRRVTGATYYKVKIGTNKKVTKKTRIIKTKKIKFYIKKLRPKKTYYIKVRAYNASAKAGAWSKVKKIKVK